MRFRVEYSARAERDVFAAYAYIAQDAPLNAMRWLEGLEVAVASLTSSPERCPLAPESEALAFELRQQKYGSYRVLFVIDGRSVQILHIRHSRRDVVKPGDLE